MRIRCCTSASRRTTATPHALEIGARHGPNGPAAGRHPIYGTEFDTTGWLGRSRTTAGSCDALDLPAWIMLPGAQWLSMARAWHFFFAWVFVLNGLAFLLYADREPAPHARPRARPAASCAGIGASIRDHLRFRHPTGEAAKRYNVLQKLAYLVVIFVPAAADR